MGLFSSIGGILGGAVGSFFGPAGTVIGAGLGGAGGSAIDSNQANKAAEGYYNQQMDFARQQFQFQQDYAKNVAQWRVEDAKKAGLHPMAALGISSPNFSPVSAPSSPAYDSGSNIDPMEFGQSLNYAATKAKDAKQQETMVGLQIQGMKLDNEYKQAQIDQLKVDTLASSIASNQALGSVPSPRVNQQVPTGLPNGSYSLDNPYGKDLFTLFTLARHGDTFVEVPHPDIADAITETEWKNVIAAIDAEAQAQNGIIKPPVNKLNPDEREAVRLHRYELVRVPGIGWKLDRNPSRVHPLDKLSRYEKFKRKNTQRWNGRTEVKGKIF